MSCPLLIIPSTLARFPVVPHPTTRWQYMVKLDPPVCCSEVACLFIQMLLFCFVFLQTAKVRSEFAVQWLLMKLHQLRQMKIWKSWNVFRYRSPSDLSNTNVQHDCLDELIWTLQRGVNHLLPYSLSVFYS